MKQSLKAYHPVLHELTPFSKFITQPFAVGMAKHIAYCGEATKQSFALQIKQQPLSNLILIGPEGDFSPKEILAATAQHFQIVTLGNARLRTETAALAATVIANNY
jgi:16S rRNA (uracil1498-N3)-methyltransferase